MSNDYLKIPESVLSNKNICATSKILYGYISLLCHQNGYWYSTNGKGAYVNKENLPAAYQNMSWNDEPKPM